MAADLSRQVAQLVSAEESIAVFYVQFQNFEVDH